MSKTAPAEPIKPPRYNDIVRGDDGAAASAPATTNAPAAALRDAENASTLDGQTASEASASFRVDAREDQPGDRDLVGRKPRIKDLVEQRLEVDDVASYGDRFDWSRDEYGARYSFSRRYQAPWGRDHAALLIDFFSIDNEAVRTEVERKRAALEAHNASAAIAVEALMEAANDQAAFEAGLEYMRQRGEAQFAYIPMIGIPKDIDLAGLRAGKVLDLPPPPREESFVPAGRGVAFR
ncbi:MAG: hypothetical protein ABSD03_15990 [Vulcanimicrobiaceae bacterium]|jgi:hypothetical protein